MNLIRRHFKSPAVRQSNDWDAWDQLLGRMMDPWSDRPAGLTQTEGGSLFSPPVDIVQDESEVVLRAELPGVSKDEIDITIHEDSLTLRGTKKSESESKEGRYQYVERRYGEFLRTFQLPAAVDSSKVEAKFHDGVLEIRMPIADEAKPRKIDVRVN